MGPLLGLAGSDCERIGDGVLAQPMNAWSSLAFLIAGAWIVLRGRRATGRRLELQVYGVAVATNALGGLVFHGPQWPGAGWVHDLSILSVLLFIVVFDLARLRERPTGWTMRAYAEVLGVTGLLLAVVPASSYALFVLGGVAAGAYELLEYRHDLPAIRAEGLTARRAARLGVVAVAVLAGTAFWIGRTGAPLCDPGSAFQWHAVWHLLAAAGMALYAYGAIEPHPAQVSRSA